MTPKHMAPQHLADELLTREDLLILLDETQALMKGHFLLSSGLHSDTYVQCARLLQYPRHAVAVGAALAAQFDADKIDKVAAPAVGGLVIGFTVAEALDVPMIFAERAKFPASSEGPGGKGPMTLRRGFEIISGERVLVVEDVVTTGGSAAEVAALVSDLGGHVAGIGSVIRRGPETEVNRGWKYLLEVGANAWSPEECPLCKQGVELYAPGSSRSAGQ